MKAARAQATPPVDATSMIAQARACLDKAYACYSQFPVAAAVMDERGAIFTGVNVENASYGLTMCAERVAAFSAIAAGARRIVAVAVTSKSKQSVPPCGACRQVLAEFCDPGTPVYVDTGQAAPEQWTISTLLPNAFDPSHLRNDR